MTIKQSGPYCDVCELLIWWGMVHTFSIECVKNRHGNVAIMHCCDDCKPKLEKGASWTELPEGPLKRAFKGCNAQATVTVGARTQ